MHCKKFFFFFFNLYTVLRLSLFILLCWTFLSRLLDPVFWCFFLRSVVSGIGPTQEGFSCSSNCNLVRLWRGKEPPRCPVLFSVWVGLNSYLIRACSCCFFFFPPFQPWLKWYVSVQSFRVFINIDFGLENLRKTCKSCDSVLCFFLYTFDMNLTHWLLSLYNKFCILFFVRRKNYNMMFFFGFLWLNIFNTWHCWFWILPSLLCHSVKGLFNIFKWSKNACPTFLEMKSISWKVWM